MNPTRILSVALLSAAALAHAPAEAHRRVWGGISIGIGVPLYAPYYYGYAYPAPVVAYPAYPVTPAYQPVPPAPAYQPVPPAPVPAAPEPIFYPRKGQTTAQTEADHQACNRWATTQRDAMADASVFHRATLACMDGRGYSAR